MDKSMSRRPALDLAQAGEIASLEAATAMFELPKRRIWGACVEDIAHWASSGKISREVRGA